MQNRLRVTLSSSTEKNSGIYETAKITVLDSNRIEVLCDEEGKSVKKSFSRIHSDAFEYANTLMLAGEYKDKNGKPYLFTTNQKAILPDREFQYGIGLDFVFADADFIDYVEGDTYVRLCYKITNDQLIFYDSDPESEVTRIMGKPILELTKVK